MASAPSLETIAPRQQQRAIVPRILLADDQHEILEAVHSILSADAEFVVAGTAEDGMHAVQLAVNLKPDVLVLDIAMPGVNGIEAACWLTRRLRIAGLFF